MGKWLIEEGCNGCNKLWKILSETLKSLSIAREYNAVIANPKGVMYFRGLGDIWGWDYTHRCYTCLNGCGAYTPTIDYNQWNKETCRYEPIMWCPLCFKYQKLEIEVEKSCSIEGKQISFPQGMSLKYMHIMHITVRKL